ncbi:hypothetical protein I3760_16G063400 [Carya illinoinensis]|nr:hypothetical protein I3760_16G063400 [Carya illinoinensis]
MNLEDPKPIPFSLFVFRRPFLSVFLSLSKPFHFPSSPNPNPNPKLETVTLTQPLFLNLETLILEYGHRGRRKTVAPIQCRRKVQMYFGSSLVLLWG